MLSKNFDKTYNKILISEGIFFNNDSKIEKTILKSIEYVSSFRKIIEFLQQNVSKKWMDRFLSEARINLIIKLDEALKSTNFKQEIVKNKKVQKGIEIIISRFKIIWPKLKKLNFLRGKVSKNNIKADVSILTSVIPNFAEILVQIFSIIEKLFTFVTSKIVQNTTDMQNTDIQNDEPVNA